MILDLPWDEVGSKTLHKEELNAGMDVHNIGLNAYVVSSNPFSPSSSQRR